MSAYWLRRAQQRKASTAHREVAVVHWMIKQVFIQGTLIEISYGMKACAFNSAYDFREWWPQAGLVSCADCRFRESQVVLR